MKPLVLGIDPGTEQTAMVALTPAPGGRLAVVLAEMVESTPVGIGRFYRHAGLVGSISVVGIEWVMSGLFKMGNGDAALFRAKPLLASQGVAGEASGIASERFLRVEKIEAAAWRRAVIGTPKRGKKIPGVKVKAPMDALIAKAIPMLVIGCDGFGSGSHLYDAAGVGVYASRIVWRFGGRAA